MAEWGMVLPCSLPESALLARYRDGGAYTDCYALELPTRVTHEAYVAAFYTTRLFKLERMILRLAVNRPSTDEGARALAAGADADFAAWSVEARAENQLLMCDFMGRTRSWLMVELLNSGTRLYFGSAVVPKHGSRGMGFPFDLLLGFHKVYSRALLAAAARRLRN